MRPPKSIQRVVEAFNQLPGIGPKSAQRLAYYLLHVPQERLDVFADAVKNLRKDTKTCNLCFNISETDPCSICNDLHRDQSTICVVEQPLDVTALENSAAFKGVYHVLHGSMNPLDNIGPDQLYIPQLFHRIKHSPDSIREVIIATNPTMEGESTALYIQKMIQKEQSDIIVTRIGRGLPTGADLEYADAITLMKALESRQKY